MPRIARIIDSSGGCYHITTRGNNRQLVFHDDRDKFVFLCCLAAAKKKFVFKIFHYVLMDNHVHMVLSPNDGRELKLIMKAINLTYSLEHKKKYGRTGHLWESRYDSRIVRHDRYMLEAGIYDELNPIRANMVVSPGDYRWSSYEFNSFGVHSRLLDKSPAFLSLGDSDSERRAAYKLLVEMVKDRGLSPRKLDRGLSPRYA